MQKIVELTGKLQNDTGEELNPRLISEKLGIHLTTEPINLRAKQLEPPRIRFGNGESLQDMRSASFNFKNAVYESRGPIEWALLHF